MVSHGDGWHAKLRGAVHQLSDPHGTVQERVFGVEVEVDEGVSHGLGMVSGRGQGARAAQ